MILTPNRNLLRSGAATEPLKPNVYYIASMTWSKVKLFRESAEAQVQPAAKYRRVGHGNLTEKLHIDGKKPFK